MTSIQSVFREYAPQYRKKFDSRMPHEHKKVMDAILSCRTSSCGMTVYECTGCAKTHYIFRSCGNRHCPTCQGQKALDWMQRQIERSVHAPYFMITFTVPEAIRSFIRSRQRLAYNALFKASSEALKKLARDNKYIGGDVPGFFGVLHTWGRTLNYHPHVHYVAAGGAWSTNDKQWRPSRPNFYLPVKALSKIYRAKFRELMINAGMIDRIPGKLWREGWNVNIQPVGAAERGIRYLSRYVFKVAISDHRIVSAEEGFVTFKYRKPKSRRTRLMKISSDEFMRRFLQHALPTGFMKVRYYGFMNACCSVDLDEIRAHIDIMNRFDEPQGKPEIYSKKPLHCPDCGAELKYRYSVLPYKMASYLDTG